MFHAPLNRSMTAVAALALLGAACDLGTTKLQGETAEAPPKVRKLYAPGIQPGDEAETAVAEGSDPASPEGDALEAALLGTDRAPEEANAEEAARPAPRRRRAVRRAAPVESEPLEKEAAPGQMSDGAFQSVVTDWRGVRSCLASEAGRLAPGSGAIRVSFTIRGDGQVVKSKVVEASNDVARAISPCVEQRARRIRFSAFAGATDQIEKTAKFVF